jgi:hypothetical protein
VTSNGNSPNATSEANSNAATLTLILNSSVPTPLGDAIGGAILMRMLVARAYTQIERDDSTQKVSNTLFFVVIDDIVFNKNLQNYKKRKRANKMMMMMMTIILMRRQCWLVLNKKKVA